ncbi:zinc finger, CCHC-type containing protein [Tanacetum coccineum]
MGDANPIRTLRDYSKPSHEGYRNTIELPEGNNVVPLQSDTIREIMRMCLFQFSLRDQASNWFERLPAGSITTWEDLTTRFLAQFFPPGRTAKLLYILIFQQHQGESFFEAWTCFKDLLRKVPHRGLRIALDGDDDVLDVLSFGSKVQCEECQGLLYWFWVKRYTIGLKEECEMGKKGCLAKHPSNVKECCHAVSGLLNAYDNDVSILYLWFWFYDLWCSNTASIHMYGYGIYWKVWDGYGVSISWIWRIHVILLAVYRHVSSPLLSQPEEY